MYVFHHVEDLQKYLETERVNKRTLGFIPTMGALHAGHLSLIEHSLAENQITLCSIFVNPTQFNDNSDLEKYPRTPEIDLQKLALVGCQVVFLPTVEEIYPNGQALKQAWDFGGLEDTMEGEKRPGHFAGMAQVVKRFLDIVQPDYLYMGQKDFQQQLIVRKMVRDQQMNLTVRTVPTKREEDGLAMSSRNVLLPPSIRKRANLIFNTLSTAKLKLLKGEKISEIEAWAMLELKQIDFSPEYFSIVNGHDLQSVPNENNAELIVACTAVQAGKVRLIDNMILRGEY